MSFKLIYVKCKCTYHFNIWHHIDICQISNTHGAGSAIIQIVIMTLQGKYEEVEV